MIDSTSLSVVKEELSSAEIERVDDKKVFDHGLFLAPFTKLEVMIEWERQEYE